MKKVLSILSCLILTFILLCVSPNKVNAAENTWYQTAANNAKNPVLLEDNQYFQGVSINSHIISDLTFMEIPFTDYLENGDKQVQVITFSEALYMKDGDILKEMVMYVYYPDEYNGENTTIYTDIDFIRQQANFSDIFIDLLNNYDIAYTHRFKWSKISEYDNIVKYSFGTLFQKIIGEHVINPIDNPSINNWLLKDVGDNHNKKEVNTIFDLKISSFIQKKGIYSNELVENDGGEKWYKNQNFQFVNCIQNPLASNGIMLMTNVDPSYEHITSCVSINTNTVSIQGETVKYRYTKDRANKLSFTRISGDYELYDIYYLFFNVFDDGTNEQWDKEKYITKVKLKYLNANLNSHTNSKIKTFPKSSSYSYFYTLDFLDKNGALLLQDGDSFATHDSPVDLTEKIYEKFSKQFDNESLYIEQTIVPEKITKTYLENSSANTWVSFTAGLYSSRKVTYLTLFNTKSDEFKAVYDQTEDINKDLVDKYQYGLVFGNKDGYPVVTKVTSDVFNFLAYSSIETDTKSQSTLAAVIGLTEIEYEENGVAQRVTVSTNDIDNSNVTKPKDQDNDPWVDIPGPKVPKDDDTGNWFWDFIQKIINFFTITLPAWWDENQTVVLGILIAVGIVIVGIFIWKLLSPLITAEKVKKAIKEEKKKE